MAVLTPGCAPLRAVPNLLTLLHSAKPSLRLDALQCFHYLLRGGREERRAVLAHISPAALVQVRRREGAGSPRTPS